MSEEEQKYKSEFTKLRFYYIGGRWGYAIIRLIDSSKEVKVRLAKCKKQEAFPKTEKYKWVDVPAEHVKDLSQVQKINFKSTDNFDNIAKEIVKELEEIKQLKETKEAATEEKEKEPSE
ncbi:MAG: hypothetical protein E3J70_05990 [Candidatus Heimdallarchaeota archaeon]|nr:MAG: hypothetical protein E3J70_05990 [Candidatus Heimdallarchaeota archaeon]